jgi:cysteinyl-tRNA synthetase
VIVFDVLFRLLRHLYGADHVTYVRNITDVDDKINARAAERNITIQKLTEETYRDFKDDVAALGCLDPTHEPRATDYIRRTDRKLDMVTLIERLVRSENAYCAEGHVLFHVPSMPDYGKLSRRTLDEMIAGARVEVAPYKRNPMDFVLWKPSDQQKSNIELPAWRSPCGINMPGRPGWHIECSAMSGALLGETFDIHGGGIDLLFPHHENEIAQSRCAFHTRVMANYWMHNGFLQVEGEKMSKSEGNFVTIRELLKTDTFGSRLWPGEVLRLAMLTTHYRQPIDFTIQKLEEAHNLWKRWGRSVDMFPDIEPDFSNEFLGRLCDDLNTPAALRLLSEFGTTASGGSFGGGPPDQEAQKHAAALLKGCSDLLGLTYGAAREDRDERVVQSMIAARNAARKAKNFAESDRIRDELTKMGVVLKDTKDGTTWEIAR